MILITGATGLLGSTLQLFLTNTGCDVMTQGLSSNADNLIDLTHADETFFLLEKIQPKIIINLVGLTQVDFCETNINEAYKLNVKTVENLVKWIKISNSRCHLIHISTDHFYDGAGIHTEDDIKLINVYALSKYAGELAAAQVQSTILRTNFIGRSKTPKRQSFTDWVYHAVKTQTPIQVFDDVFFNPLSMTSLSEMIHVVIEKQPHGIFNLGANKGMSKAELSFAFAEKLNLPTNMMSRINSSQSAQLKAYRPKNMLMDCSKFEKKLGITLPFLKDEIVKIAQEYHEKT